MRAFAFAAVALASALALAGDPPPIQLVGALPAGTPVPHPQVPGLMCVVEPERWVCVAAPIGFTG